MTFTADAVATTDALIDLAKLWIIVFGLVNVIRTAAEFRFLAIAWLAVFALYPVRGALYNQYICQCTESGRVAWNFIFSNPNDLAGLTLVPLGLAAGVAYVERTGLWRLPSLIGVGVLALLVMLTQSRGAMLAMGTAAILLVLSSRRRGRDLFLLTVMVASVAAPKTVWQRLAGLSNASVEGGMQDVDPEGSAEARWQIWQIAASTIQQSPLTGVGAGMMPATHRLEALRRGADLTVRGARDTHSTYLRVAAETGIPGLLLYLAIWGTLFARMRRARRFLRAARPREHQMLLFLELSLVAYQVASLFGTYGSLSFTYLYVGVAWLAADILERQPWYVPNRAAGGAPVAMVTRRG